MEIPTTNLRELISSTSTLALNAMICFRIFKPTKNGTSCICSVCPAFGNIHWKENTPIWGRMEGDCLAQVITPYELSLYKETGKITVPDALQQVGEDDNPIVILYHLK